MKVNLPSPLEELHLPLFEEKGLQVFVKRDDLIHPLVSGNKWRKLKYLLIRAIEEQKDHLVTFGGAYSNHLLATAAAAKSHGLKASAFVRGETVNNPVLQTCRDLGMNLYFTDRESYRDKKTLFLQNFGTDPAAYFIDEGGASAEAVKGCAELITELPKTYDHIFCAAGTGTTAAGLYSGIRTRGLATTMHVIPVLKGGSWIRSEIEKFIILDEKLIIHPDFHFGGYAKSNTQLLQLIINWHRATGMLIEPVYTGKLIFGLMELIRKNYFERGAKILWIHTGGLSGLEGFREEFAIIDPDFTQNFPRVKAN